MHTYLITVYISLIFLSSESIYFVVFCSCLRFVCVYGRVCVCVCLKDVNSYVNSSVKKRNVKYNYMFRLHKENQGWRDSSTVKSTHCSLRGPIFESLHLHSRSQQSVSRVPGYSVPSSGPHNHQACIWYMHIQENHSYTQRYVNIERGGKLGFIAVHVFSNTQE